MKRAFYISVLLLSSLCVLAQDRTSDTANYAFMDYQSGLPDHPLVFLNDKLYEGDLAGLKVKVTHIEIYKGPGACAIFGVKAANGVIIMGTKKKLPMYFSKPSTDTSFDGRVVYVVDGEISERRSVNEKDILIKSTIKGAVLDGIYGRKLDSIVTSISRKYAIEQYQKKLSTFSKDYNNYLQINRNDDSNVLYVLNGVPMAADENDNIKKVYASLEKLKSVNFIKSIASLNVYPERTRPLLVITTKK